MEENLLKTCLYDKHVALNALMSPFGGFIMPIQYTNITDEHNAVRNNAGMFDVSHMGEIFVSGPDAEKFVNHIFTNNVTGIPDGKILYGMMLYPDGTVVDDLLVYKEFEPSKYLLVVNASNIAKDHEWICAQKEGFDVEVVNASDSWGEIALQGPAAEKFAVETLGLAPAADLGFYTYYEADWKGARMIVSRTGYTGEDGFNSMPFKLFDRRADRGLECIEIRRIKQCPMDNASVRKHVEGIAADLAVPYNDIVPSRLICIQADRPETSGQGIKISFEHLGNISPAGNVRDHDVSLIGIHAASTAFATHDLNPMLSAIVKIDLGLKILIPSYYHSRIHPPNKERLTLDQPCHILLHGKIKGQTAVLDLR